MLDTYQQRATQFQAEIEVAEALSSQASNRRGSVFLAAIACVIIARYAPIPQIASTVLYALGPILLAVFVALIFGHRRISDRLERARYLKQLNLDAAARLRRDWDHFPVPPTPVGFRDHATAKDTRPLRPRVAIPPRQHGHHAGRTGVPGRLAQ